MLARESCVLALSVLLLAACGGGGGGGGVISAPTFIAGTVTPPVAPAAAAPIQSVAPPGDMLLPPGALPAHFPAITQSMDYTFDPAALPSLKVASLAIDPVNSTTSFIGPGIGVAAYPGDPTLGQLDSINVLSPGAGAGIGRGAPLTNETLGGLPAVVLTIIVPGGGGSEAVGYVLPYSLALNPAGYTYQTFGVWSVVGAPAVTEGYFSTGVPTAVATLPAVGTASYTGVAVGSLVDAATREPADTTATMNATVDFAARTVAFATTGTTSLSNNAAVGALPTANPGLNMSGTLSYAAGSNTFAGPVSTTNGMSGNATGRFYGPGIAAATATKAIGAPPEIGGTFAVMGAGVGAMQGAFGGN